MLKEKVRELTNTFEEHARKTEDGIEFWLARDLQKLLGYLRWENFQNVLLKAQTAWKVSNHEASDHFRDVTKMIPTAKQAEREVFDIILTRYACYLIAQNGDPRKEEIAFAQTYFALQTRKMEIIEKRILDIERVSARKKLSETEKELSGVIYEHTKSEKNFGLIRSKGDKALFGLTTEQMKLRWNVPKGRALADFAPTIILKAKDFATEITIFNTKANQLSTEQQISDEHVTNNQSVRDTLLDRGIRPESLSPDEDLKKVERKIESISKKELKNLQSLEKKKK
jgi:DNA-damage-inducible protein D